ncbi:hypothetical protein WH95_13155 [Kiloniella litopenaei]|uniref:Uncharacterized protein n=1 Tax=Kiloniella litopenaei TaxID=1549748 RepID=A0A0M2R9Z3_9PROT|nr:hypothetical protein [Kiloniella litopenaei]KKJ76423.1 hypothetical protein WH95_13155 [Kiloniella litopenaei]
MNCRYVLTASVLAILLSGCAFGGKSEQAVPEKPAKTYTSEPSTLAVPPSGDVSSGHVSSGNSNEVINQNVTGTVNETADGLSISDQPVTNSYPYGSADPSASPAQTQDQLPAQGQPIIRAPDGKLYSAETPKTEVDYENDVASCHYYARGLVAHDARIEDDRGGSFGDSHGGGTSSLLTLRQNIDKKDVRKRQAIHFNRCMNTKGYYQR